MKILTDLLSTDYGLMSLFIIVFAIGMGIWFAVLFMGKMRIDALNAEPNLGKNYAEDNARKPTEH